MIRLRKYFLSFPASEKGRFAGQQAGFRDLEKKRFSGLSACRMALFAQAFFFAAFTALAALTLAGCSEEQEEPGKSEYTITFDAAGGSPIPSPVQVKAGGKIAEPDEVPSNGDLIFSGWFTSSGEKFNFNISEASSDLTLYAKWWEGPRQFIFINGIDLEFHYARIRNWFGSQVGKDIAIGQSFILYCFERPREVMLSNLEKHLAQSLEFEIPVLVQLDAVTFMDARPDLWNWWDPAGEGYDPANKNNVEWTSWSDDDAVKLGWLNWGQQIRLNPMPNLMSPEYRQAVDEQMGEFIEIVMDWYENLPADKKWLFAGIKSTGEMAIGVNNWYYPGGNSYLDQDPANDPQTGINMYDFPSRGVQTIGYAALKTGGIKSSGLITGDDIAQLARKHSEIVSKLCADHGVPRELVFAHAGGAGKDLEACLNEYACPSWSFYGAAATQPKNFNEALSLLESSDAPYFGIAEWSVGAPTDPRQWSGPIEEGLSIPKCRFLSIYANVVGSDLFHRSPNMAAVEGIKTVQSN